MTLGERIRRFRRLRGLTQKELGIAVGFPETTADSRIRKYEMDLMKPKKELVDSDYLHGAILSPDAQRQIEEGVKGIAQKTLNLSEIKKMKIPVPSLDRQKEFAVFVLQVDKSKCDTSNITSATQYQLAS